MASNPEPKKKGRPLRCPDCGAPADQLRVFADLGFRRTRGRYAPSQRIILMECRAPALSMPGVCDYRWPSTHPDAVAMFERDGTLLAPKKGGRYAR